MTEKIHAALDTMLENPKAKTFLNHLVRSYMPATNVTKVTETPKGDFKCVLSKVALICEQEITKALNSAGYQMALKESMASTLEAKKVEALTGIVGGKVVGVTGKNTTTFMSEASYEAFADWVVTRALKGDKHLNWLMGSIRRESLISRAENIKDVDVQRKVSNFKKNTNAATFTLGDSSDVLAKLKASLEGK